MQTDTRERPKIVKLFLGSLLEKACNYNKWNLKLLSYFPRLHVSKGSEEGDRKTVLCTHEYELDLQKMEQTGNVTKEKELLIR